MRPVTSEIQELPLNETHGFEVEKILNGLMKGVPLCVMKEERTFLFENLCDLASENSFRKSKPFWKKVKSVFLENIGYKPFVYFNNERFVLSEGKCDEDLSLIVKEEELLFEGNSVVVNPLVLQKLYSMYISGTSEVVKDEADEYAQYYISRELEKFQVKKIENNMYGRK